MPTKCNPKQEGSNLFDCIPQTGPCPNDCNQCYYNRPGAFYTETPSIPTPEEVGDGIVRMNCGHDSNIERELVIQTASQYNNVFFNTSIPKLDFPGPVVLTANPNEEKYPIIPGLIFSNVFRNLMFVRLRVSPTNLDHIKVGVSAWTQMDIPVVLTFMAYYDAPPVALLYEWKIRHVNPYWCPTSAFIRFVLDMFCGNRLVSYCGSFAGQKCLYCRNCETYYIQTMKRLRGE